MQALDPFGAVNRAGTLPHAGHKDFAQLAANCLPVGGTVATNWNSGKAFLHNQSTSSLSIADGRLVDGRAEDSKPSVIQLVSRESSPACVKRVSWRADTSHAASLSMSMILTVLSMPPVLREQALIRNGPGLGSMPCSTSFDHLRSWVMRELLHSQARFRETYCNTGLLLGLGPGFGSNSCWYGVFSRFCLW